MELLSGLESKEKPSDRFRSGRPTAAVNENNDKQVGTLIRIKRIIFIYLMTGMAGG